MEVALQLHTPLWCTWPSRRSSPSQPRPPRCSTYHASAHDGTKLLRPRVVVASSPSRRRVVVVSPRPRTAVTAAGGAVPHKKKFRGTWTGAGSWRAPG